MTSRERVLAALNFQETDRVPCDLDAMGSTGISAFAYPKLVKALGLPPRRTRIYDTWQMIAVVDRDVLDALECDCICVNGENCANVLPEPEKWRPYDFNGRLEALVLDPSSFRVLPDGTIEQRATPFCGVTHMPPNGYVFSEEHGGQAVDLSGEFVLEDLDRLRDQLLAEDVTPEQARRTADCCRRAKEAGGERALLFNGVSAMLGYRGGLANFSMLCLSEPGYVRKLHEILTEAALRRAEALIPAVAPYVDIVLLSSDDQGTQCSTILPPEVYRELFTPFYRQLNERVHSLAPHLKTFYHSCGAIYSILDAVIEGGFDILNPVQWTAGGHSPEEWKRVADGRLVLWGGGVDTQTVLPGGSVADVERQAAEMTRLFSRGGGYVFTAIHNIMAEIAPEKVIAMYRSARSVPLSGCNCRTGKGMASC